MLASFDFAWLGCVARVVLVTIFGVGSDIGSDNGNDDRCTS